MSEKDTLVGIESPGYWKTAGDGTIDTVEKFDSSASELTKQFIVTHHEMYSEDPDLFAALGRP